MTEDVGRTSGKRSGDAKDSGGRSVHPPRFSVQDAESILEEQEMEAPVSQSCHPCSVRASGTQDTLGGGGH